MTNFNEIESLFIHYSAPTLCGIKPANLFTLSETQFHEIEIKKWKAKLKTQNLCLSFFKTSSTRWMIFVYDFYWITKIISDEIISSYLYGKGYTHPLNIDQTLNELFNRLKYQKKFPHEIGLLLGYPIDDVISYEENNGQNCKYCGVWKSYSNSSEAKSCCIQYKCCSMICKQLFDEGLSVPQIIKKYKEAANHAA